MARSGIYVNGKEVVARYFGDKLVWQKSRDKLLTTITYSKAWKKSLSLHHSINDAEFVQYFKTSVTDDLEFDITRVEIGNRSWKAKKYYLLIRDLYSSEQRVTSKIAFSNQVEMNSFINYTQSNPSGEIKIYMEKR